MDFSNDLKIYIAEVLTQWKLNTVEQCNGYQHSRRNLFICRSIHRRTCDIFRRQREFGLDGTRIRSMIRLQIIMIYTQYLALAKKQST